MIDDPRVVRSRSTRSGWPASWLRTDTQRVLILDADPQASGLLATMLELAGNYEARQVHCAADALAVATEFPPAILFLDVEFPALGAYEVARLMHQRAELRTTRFIALTDRRDHAAREDARAAGFERFLAKPVTEHELYKVLRRRTGIRD